MKQITTELSIGLPAPVTLLHVSDTHLTLADERDGERKLKLAEARAKYFVTAEQNLADTEALARELGCLIVHTGDLLDFVSAANIERAKKFTDENDCFMAAGNHEFSLYVGEAWEDADYRNQSLDRVQAAFKNNIRFASRIVGGVNLVAIDNGYYLFDEEHLELLKAEAAKGLPILLFMHNPLFERVLYDNRVGKDGQGIAYLVATPPALMRHYNEHRYKQQLADEPTLRMVEYIKSEPAIKALFTGHLHFDYEGMVTDTLPQYVTGIGTARKIVIK